MNTPVTITLDLNRVRAAVNMLVRNAHGVAVARGDWAHPETGVTMATIRDGQGQAMFPAVRDLMDILPATHATLFAGFASQKLGIADERLPHRGALEVAIAEVVLTLLDVAGGFDMDLPGTIVELLEKNIY
jgi:hypothetical protein